MVDLLILIIPMSGVFLFIFTLYMISNSKVSNIDKKKKSFKSDSNLRVFTKNFEFAESSFRNSEYSKASNLYLDIIENCPSITSLDEYNIYLNCAISLFKIGKIDLAYKYFILAISKNRDSFEASFYLGVIEYKKRNFERALNRFSIASQLRSNDRKNQKYIGLTLANLRKWNEAAHYLKQVSSVINDPEVIYYYALCNEYLDRKDTALNYLNQIKSDLTFGAKACLHAGIINCSYKKYYEAKDDLLAGLTYHNLTDDILIELKYQLAIVSIYLKDYKSVVHYLKDIYSSNATYKDVEFLYVKYSTLIKDDNLYHYLTASESYFLSLTRRIVKSFFVNGTFNILDCKATEKFVEYRIKNDTDKWSESAIFRFYSDAVQIENSLVTPIFDKIKDERIGKGYCVCATSFSESLKTTYMSRPIEFIEGEQLSEIIENLDKK